MKRQATFYSLNSRISKENSFSNEFRKNGNKVSPSDSVIRNLLNYSRALTILKTQDTGIIRLVMN
ncbi:MAG: hypothetical protein NTX43_02135 [Bacteroidetes bacterium]|nr:hypothetical protein [Bacteroidota bacterium]